MNIISSNVAKLKLKPITDRSFKKVKIGKDCKLRDFIEYEMSLKFKRGHAYYEFIHEKENISEDRELIFMDKVTVNCMCYRLFANSIFNQRNSTLGKW